MKDSIWYPNNLLGFNVIWDGLYFKSLLDKTISLKQAVNAPKQSLIFELKFANAIKCCHKVSWIYNIAIIKYLAFKMSC